MVKAFELESHEFELLRGACESLERADEAARAIEADGAYVRDRFGQVKPHPALAEERNSRLAAARLIAQLGLSEATDPEPPRRR